MIPQSRQEFKEFCLRALGAPVLQVNIDDTQVEDRIDEAIYVYQQYHMDAVVRQYLKHEITASTMVLNPVSGTFANGEQLRSTSGTVFAFGAIYKVVDANTLQFYCTTGVRFANGDVVTGTQSGATGTIVGLTLGDMDNEYFEVTDENVIAVSRIFVPWDNRLGAGDILFDPMAQFNMSLLANFTNTSLVPYYMGRQYQQLLNDTLRGRPMMRYQRHQNRIYVDVLWRNSFAPGQFVVFDCYTTLDPDTYGDVWSDEWLQRYTIALLKRQWGTNLSKYNGIQLPGGVVLDGKTMYTEAVEEVKELREELKTTYQLPIDFFIG